MKIARLHIENFPSIRHLDISLRETTVLIGPNNAAKTAIIDAPRIALTRRWEQRGTGFTEYDIHLENDGADPKALPGVQIEIRVEEDTAGQGRARDPSTPSAARGEHRLAGLSICL